MIEPARRVKQLPRYLFAEVDRVIREKEAQGVDVIRLGIGDPDLPTPSYIVERAAAELRRTANHRYPPDDGLPEFREAVALYYGRRFNVKLDPDTEVLPLIGSKEGIANIAYAFLDPGHITLVPDPGYPVYGTGTLFAGGESCSMPLEMENGFHPRFDRIPVETARRARLIFLNYPNNPTGAAATPELFREAVDFARANRILLCHDAAYSELVLDGNRPVSVLESEGALDTAVEFNSLSKTFNMTGWRIGYAVGCRAALEVLGRYKTNVDSGLFRAIQFAGAEALLNPSCDQFIESVRDCYRSRRNLVVDALREMGFSPCPCGGSFYVWTPVPGGYDSAGFTTRLLDKTGVVVTPGSGFGRYGEGYFRIALTVDTGRLREAMHRIKGSGLT